MYTSNDIVRDLVFRDNNIRVMEVMVCFATIISLATDVGRIHIDSRRFFNFLFYIFVICIKDLTAPFGKCIAVLYFYLNCYQLSGIIHKNAKAIFSIRDLVSKYFGSFGSTSSGDMS